MLRLLGSFSSKLSTKIWTVLRGSLMLMLWVSTLVLFLQTSQVTVYDTSEIYNVTAGVGSFNGTNVQQFIDLLQDNQPDYPYQVFPYNYYAPVYNLVTNPTFSSLADPVKCSGSSCFSYLLSGGLEMVTPWVSLRDPTFPLARIYDVPSIQLEFSQMPRDFSFASKDCSIFGTNTSTIAARLCVRDDADNFGVLNAGLYVCLNGTAHGACEVDSATSVPNITTTMAVFSRRATVLAGLANFSIVSTESLSPPVRLEDLDIASYELALKWLLNYTATNIPAPSSIIESFWVSDVQLTSPTTHGLLTQSFQSILAFPFWLFNANNYGNTALKTQDMIDTLPIEFYTQVAVVAPYSKIGFDKGMFIAFIVLQGAALLFIWVVLAWVWVFVGAREASALPKITSFPIFDVGFKSRVEGLDLGTGELLRADGSEALYLIQGMNARAKREW
ncbi:hypothetical protein BKA67DRAFT_617481 [Truncatella angustata]|uniref:Uncharacterized protein n=1 Tax=Truncatella angustata TaxID=152316 RepID=A0A9P9A493_9PEZI|nr:uncharacterized protein BKA67DRAFT_617481 [Truncatella angustata]KAH6660903.1 hypothetical protein BKA67DRAFT_617481 [Truncatella angustata]